MIKDDANKWIEKYLSIADQDKISSIVAEVEKKTSGEIVPMIVLRSSAIGHVPLLVSLVLICLVLIFEWAYSYFSVANFYEMPLVFLICYGLGHLASRLLWVQRLLVSEADELSQVWQRARSEFALTKISKTAQRTGVLIFVSVMERKAVVLADESIARFYQPQDWQNLVQQLAGDLKKGQWLKAFESAIKRAGDMLMGHFPIKEGDQNELPDHLVIKE